MAGLYSDEDEFRVIREDTGKASEPHRSPWRRDYARLIHSPCFRRLQGKTQVFPGHESDFYRNRLTHSLEVAQISKSIAVQLNATTPEFKKRNSRIEPDIAEIAGIAHDLGHPPFGHNGEKALDNCMKNHGGFEGNAQSLRIISTLEKKTTAISDNDGFQLFDAKQKDLRCGLNLSYRSLASILKYDCIIPIRNSDRKNPGKIIKGYYNDDAELVQKIKRHVLGVSEYVGDFKTIECSIMDIADDIAYSTYDLEDNFKAGFLTPMGLFALDEEIYDSVAKTISGRVEIQYPDIQFDGAIDADLVRRVLYTLFNKVLFGIGPDLRSILKSRTMNMSQKKMFAAAEVQAISRKLASDGYHRVRFTSTLIQAFLSGIEVKKNQDHPQLHNVRLEFQTFLFVEVLKNLTYHGIIKSPGLQVVEYRGKDIIESIFNALNSDDGIRLLPDDFQKICKNASELVRMRTICDFIAGMTDRYAFEFYSRLFGVNHLTIHKPL